LRVHEDRVVPVDQVIREKGEENLLGNVELLRVVPEVRGGLPVNVGANAEQDDFQNVNVSEVEH
jgi:hypothetical protein